MTRIVLHIGAAKTATTYIQHGLFNNAETLAEHGVYLPQSGRFQFANKTVAHHHLGWEFLDERRFKPQAGGWADLAEELKTVDAKTAIITSESLERMTYSPRRRKQLEDQVKQLSDDVTVVYAVRDQLSSLNSLYTQSVKSFRTTQNFNGFVARSLASNNFNFHRCFRSWYRNDALTLVAVPFATLIAEDPLIGFLAAAKIEVPSDKLVLQTSASNVSPGPIAVEAAKLLGRYLVAVDRKFTNKNNRGRRIYRLAALRARQNGWCDEKYWGWTPELAAKTAEELEQSNRKFARAVWGPQAKVELPMDRPMTATKLMMMDPETFSAVQIYVDQLVQRYMEMRTGQDYLKPDSDLAALDENDLEADEDDLEEEDDEEDDDDLEDDDDDDH